MLRDFQQDAENRTLSAWHEPNVFNIMPVMPTGGGKTVLVGSIISKMGTPTAAIAHRQELVSQMALCLNRARIPHGVIAPKEVVSQIVRLEHDTHGYSDFNSRADVRACGVDTLRTRETNDRWFDAVGLVVQDEGHHVLRANKWGAAMRLFPNARGLFPTAHAVRADGSGLGRVGDGLVDRLVIGPSCRELINRGYLTDYEIAIPESDIDFSQVQIGATGDYVAPQLRAATHASNNIVGNVVKHYLKYAAGKLGVTFAVDIEAAKQLASAYRAAGVPAEVITGKTPISVRGNLMRQFRARQILQLVSVDCLGEGTDVPAIEVISMVRKTASWQLYCQQFGRALRIMVSDSANEEWGSFSDAERLARIAASVKPRAMVIDHVGNCIYHGLPDVPVEYDLANETRGAKRTVSFLKRCNECLQPYERFHIACPHCGTAPEITGRSTPTEVDGDLLLLDGAALAAIRGDVRKTDGPVWFPNAAGADARKAIFRNHTERQQAQTTLRDTMALWGGWRKSLREDERVQQKRFFLQYSIDVLSAQSLGAEDARALENRIRAELDKHRIVAAAVPSD
jgi:DNA repair protein RadD